MRFPRLLALVFPGLLGAGMVCASARPNEDPVPIQAPVAVFQKRVVLNEGGAEANARSPDQAELDKKSLDAVKLKADDVPGLIAYLKLRTLNDVDANKIQALIKKLGDESFESRIQAELELEKIGLPAVAPLKLAASNDAYGVEVVHRSRACLKRIEKVPQAEVAGAVIRALAQSKSPEVLPALLAYLPLADTISVSDEIQATLTSNAIRNGKPEPILVAALSDNNTVRRTAAVVALLEGSPAGKRPAEIYPKLVEAARAEKDTDGKFIMARSLLLGAREPEAVPMLLEIIPELSRSQIWQLEDLLAQLAGADAPKARFMKTKESLVAAQTAWKEWWSRSGVKLNLASLDLKQRLLGRFVVITHDYRLGQQGVIAEYGANDKEIWKISGMMYPTDVLFTPRGRLWIADQNAGQVTERDTTGKILSTRKFEVDNGGWKAQAQPTGIQLLQNGNLLIIARNAVVEFDKDGKEVMKYVRTQQPNFGNQDIVGARKLQSGEVAIAVLNNTPQGQKPHILFVDEKGKPIKTKDANGKEIDKTFSTGMNNGNGNGLLEVGKNRLLVTEPHRIAEYDLTTGKVEWSRQTNNARCVQRLPSGNTLYIDGGVYPNRAVEITPDGVEVWSYQLKEQQVNLFRVMIR